ncbi:DUF530 family protein [Methanocaldococcus indicus]|uniref:DUF530 family protein n=1 Tax=Methanocaldococcus indicus TaxID=213231 RepID=UPI003C6D20AF
MDASNLIKIANEFLDNIKIMDKLKNIGNLKDEDLNILINELMENINFLQDLKNKMEFLEFDAPYKNVGKLKGTLIDLQDIAEYSSYIRRIATEKKGVLDRVKYSLAAHKLALGHLVEDIGNKDIVPHLPLDGAYKKMLTELPKNLINTYKEILSLLNPDKKVFSSYTVTFLTFKGGKKELKKEKVSDKNFEEYLREKYGNVIITSFKKNYIKKKLIDDQYVRKTLTVSYLKAYENDIYKKIEERLDKTLTKRQKELLKKYLDISSKYNNNVDFYGGIVDVRNLEEKILKEMELKEILENEGLYYRGQPIDELRIALEIKDRISKEVSRNFIIEKLSEDLFKFYLYKTPDERTRSYMFPSIVVTPEKEVLTWMKVDNINVPEVLDIKFKLEDILPKYNIPLKNLGGVALYLVHDWDVVEKYNFNKEEIEELLKKISLIEPVKELLKNNNIDIKKLEKYGKVKKEKTKKFLNLLKSL